MMEVASTSTSANDDSFVIRPNFKQKFRPAVAQQIIHQVLVDKLTGQSYNSELCSKWTKEIADEIRNKLKELNLDRYKYIVHVLIAEMRGEGARMGCRCFWDQDTDNIAQDIFMNESIVCVAAAFGVFYY